MSPTMVRSMSRYINARGRYNESWMTKREILVAMRSPFVGLKIKHYLRRKFMPGRNKP